MPDFVDSKALNYFRGLNKKDDEMMFGARFGDII